MNTKLNMGVIEDKSITYSKLADDVAESITATMAGSAPDWNAQEGEAGYIENRPCYVNLDNGRRITLDNADITLSSDENWYEKIIIPLNEVKISLYFYNYNEELIHYVLTEGQSVFDYNFGCKFTAVLNEYDNCDLLLTNFDDSKEYIDTVFAETKLVYDYNDNVVQKLNSEYLPNTLIKTTPQTLSDAEKNQALTNLGIDPVVWKYICDPLIIKSGQKVPEELIGEYNEVDDEYWLKYPHKAMYKIAIRRYIEEDEYGDADILIDCNEINASSVNALSLIIDGFPYDIYMYIDKDKKWAEY